MWPGRLYCDVFVGPALIIIGYDALRLHGELVGTETAGT